MEKALRYELNKILEIKDKIFPTNSPEGVTAPYLVYIVRKRPLKTLDGTTNDKESNILLNIFASTYSSMKDISKKAEDVIKTFQGRKIGVNGPFIQDITFDEISEEYEDSLKLQRGIIPFQIDYKEEF